MSDQNTEIETEQVVQTKTCTKCHVEKEVTKFNKNYKGKYGVEAVCKDCRKIYNQARKTNASTPVIVQNVRPELIQCANTTVNQLNELDAFLNNYRTGEDVIPLSELAHKPEDILKNVIHIKNLTERLLIECQASPTNSFRIRNVKESQREQLKAQIAMNLTIAAGIIASPSDIDLVFYKGVHVPSSVINADTSASCLAVIRGVAFNAQQRTELVRSFE
jgi:hypothetical protein